MDLRRKIFFSLAFFLLLCGCVGFLLSQHLQFLQEAEERQLRTLYDNFITEIDNRGQAAVTIAATLASQPWVQSALENDDRAALQRAMTPTWRMLQERFDVKQFQFHSRRAESYLRMHAPNEFGDSLRNFRFTVVEAQQSGQPVSGLERGVYGIGIRGVFPIRAANGAEIPGSVEIGFSFDKAFLESFKAKYGADVSVFVFVYDKDSDNDTTTPFATTQAGDSIQWPALSNAAEQPEIWRSRVGDMRQSHYSFRLPDYSNKAIGILDIGMDRTFYRSAAIRSVISATVTIIIALAITYLLNLSFIRLKRKALVARRQQALLDESQEQNRTMLGYIVEKEKMASLGQLVSGVAHEINTPLGVAITANSCQASANQAIESKVAQNALSKHCLHEYLATSADSNTLIGNNLLRMSSLVENFKSLAVEKDSGRLQEFSLAELVDSVIASLAASCEEKNLRVNNRIDGKIRLQDSPLEFINLTRQAIVNTWNHGLNAYGETHLEIDAILEGGALILSFEDDGPGVEKNSLGHVFDPFFTTARNKSCTGLGLSIMYNVVTQKYEGIISAQSPVAEQKGFRIDITLPVTTSERAGHYILHLGHSRTAKKEAQPEES